jgi:uroporphyrinogen-III synthase
LELREGESGTDLMNTIPQMLLFPSSGSVAAVRPYLDWLRGQAVRPLVAAMGPQSGAAASEAGFAPDIVAPDASIDAFVAAVAHRLETP